MNDSLQMFLQFFGIAALLIIFIYPIVKAGQAAEQVEKPDSIALTLIAPMTVLLIFVGFGGSFIFKDLNNDSSAFAVFGILFLSAIWIAVLQIIHSLARQRLVAN